MYVSDGEAGREGPEREGGGGGEKKGVFGDQRASPRRRVAWTNATFLELYLCDSGTCQGEQGKGSERPGRRRRVGWQIMVMREWSPIDVHAWLMICDAGAGKSEIGRVSGMRGTLLGSVLAFFGDVLICDGLGLTGDAEAGVWAVETTSAAAVAV